jgi:hypothetical protein
MSINCPAARDSVTVTVQGTGPVRTICAWGDVITPIEALVNILVKAYLGWSPVIPPTPEGQPATITGQNWFIANVPVPDSSSVAPGAKLTLVAWTVSGTGIAAQDIQPFYGLEGGGTDCCAGSGQVAPRAHSAGVALAMAPVLWSVLAAGFGAGAALFNGTWSLTLRHITGGFCLWDNGGGGDTPLVELRCESPLALAWQLRFQTDSAAVHYTLPAVQWNPLNSNVLRLHEGDGFPEGALPESLTVQPG